MSLRWAIALRAAGASDRAVSSWHTLRAAVSRHQGLLCDNGIGREVSERDRVRVNARRVGLEAPPFADEQSPVDEEVGEEAESLGAEEPMIRGGRDPTMEEVLAAIHKACDRAEAERVRKEAEEAGLTFGR